MIKIKKQDLYYFIFICIISLIYLSYLIVTPIIGIYRYKNIPKEYKINIFEEKIISRITNKNQKKYIQKIYKKDPLSNKYILLNGLTLKDKQKTRHILKNIHSYNTNSVSFFLIIIVILYLIRYIISLFYRDIKPDKNFTPMVSIIIPVKNEEKFIYKTIKKCCETGYPPDKLEIIVINDGSTDNTKNEIEKAIFDFNNVITYNYKMNKGKRIAITKGCEIAKGEVYVMLDSDTFLKEGSILQIVQHFKDKEIAAVSGHTLVYNLKENLLTKIQGFKYYISYRLFKSFESIFGTVTCCPGCFSAYRANKLKKVLNEWHSKTFLGYKCIAGEDRSLTTLLLKNNKIAYSNNALASTIVPTDLKSLSIQQMRWMRSWFRESLYVSKYMWKKNPLPALCFYITLLISFFGPMTLLREFFIMPILFLLLPIRYIIGLIFIIVIQLLYCLITKMIKFSIYGIFFSIFYFFFIIWLIPISIFTITNGNWGSRGANFK
ncbi:MAG: glycosyltransferase family 2 protein [Spirochaetes bacterium]|nr:glycosyltransferase family 2 protein [Spirochaetota bacterium]